MLIRAYQEGDQTAVIDLWHRCELIRPWNNPVADIERKRRVAPELFLVAEQAGEIVATVMAGYEGHRGWINYLAVSPQSRRAGVGRLMMEAAERLLRDKGCPKINLQVRAENTSVLAFYEALGFSDDKVVSFGKRLEQDDG